MTLYEQLWLTEEDDELEPNYAYQDLETGKVYIFKDGEFVEHKFENQPNQPKPGQGKSKPGQGKSKPGQNKPGQNKPGQDQGQDENQSENKDKPNDDNQKGPGKGNGSQSKNTYVHGVFENGRFINPITGEEIKPEE